MPFPLSADGDVPAGRLSEAAALNVVRQALVAEGVKVQADGARVTFKRALMTGGSMSPLAGANGGAFETLTRDGETVVRYRLRRELLTLIATVAVLAMAGLLVFLEGWEKSRFFASGFVVLGWGWLVGMTHIANTARFKDWLRRTLQDAV